MKLIPLSLLLVGISLSGTMYSMQNNDTTQSSKNLSQAKGLVGKAEAIIARMEYGSLRHRYKTSEEQMAHINKEKGKAIDFAQQAIPFVQAVIHDNDKKTEVVEIFKRIELIIK